MSGQGALVPASPLRLTSLRQIVCSKAGHVKHGPAASRLFCASILLCDLSRSAASALHPFPRFASSGSLPRHSAEPIIKYGKLRI